MMSWRFIRNVTLDGSKLCVNYIHAVWWVLLPLLQLLLLLLSRHFSLDFFLFGVRASFHCPLKCIQFSLLFFDNALFNFRESGWVKSLENWCRGTERECVCVCFKGPNSFHENQFHSQNKRRLPSERVKGRDREITNGWNERVSKQASECGAR